MTDTPARQSASQRFADYLLRTTTARVLILFSFHLFVFTACYFFAWLLRFEFDIPAEYNDTLEWSLPVVVSTQLFVGMFFGYYRGWWRYVGISDVLRLFSGLTIALAVLLGAWHGAQFLGYTPEVSRGALLIDWAFALLALFGARVLVRTARDMSREGEQAGGTTRRVLIVGAGDAGEALAREIQHRPQLGVEVVAFVDDHRAKRNSQIRGISVDGPIAEIDRIAKATGATEALIAIPSASGQRIRQIIRELAEAQLTFKTIPGIDQIVAGKVEVSQLRPVNVDDLIRREQIVLPGDGVRALFRGRRVLITGAGGTIGAELAAQIHGFEPDHLCLVERSEFALYECGRRLPAGNGSSGTVSAFLADIANEREISRIMDSVRPEIVLHAAAHKHVPLGEDNPAEYVRNNTLAARSFGELCDASGVERFVLISTDKAIQPTSVMGASKRAAEIALLDLDRTARMSTLVVRFGNVLGSSGSVVPLFLEQIREGGPVTVTHPEVTRYFLRTSEAISLVLQAAAIGEGGHVYMLDMGQPVKIADLARDLIRLSNHSEDEIGIVYIGLRPGEKLFEEVLLRGESIRPTVHPQIVVTEAPQPERKTVLAWLNSLANAVSNAPGEIRDVLRQLIPEYAAAPPPVRAESVDRRGTHVPPQVS